MNGFAEDPADLAGVGVAFVFGLAACGMLVGREGNGEGREEGGGELASFAVTAEDVAFPFAATGESALAAAAGDDEIKGAECDDGGEDETHREMCLEIDAWRNRWFEMRRILIDLSGFEC